jgi:tetratricopeptide (TPR) repeat protein
MAREIHAVPRGGPGAPRRRASRVVLALLLLALTVAVFLPATRNGFVDYDDDRYLTKNPVVRAGLTAGGARWAFTSFAAANWHPLTWLSHMLDVELFGMDPARHHRTSVLLHGANAALMLLVLAGLTGALLPSALVAALFALHPLHVESVAWAAERKDVLAALFWWLALGAHLRYVRRPSSARYAATALLFLAGLLAKPMLVTLPLVLLLLDWWPLGRTRPPGGDPSARGQLRLLGTRLLAEKLPLLGLAAASSAVTYLAQARGGAVQAVPLGERWAGVALAYAAYLEKTLAPAGLVFFYPRPEPLPALSAAGALLLLAGLTFLSLRWLRRRPWLAVGWLWYLGTLVPVVGVVPVGLQAIADRYTYLPLTGVFLALAWSARPLAARLPGGRVAAGIAVAALLVPLAAMTRLQIGHWRGSETLFRHALAVSPRNAIALTNLGFTLGEAGRVGEAVPLLEEAMRLRPRDPKPPQVLGTLLGMAGRLAEAESLLRRALALGMDTAEVHSHLGIVLLQTGRAAEARERFLAAVRIDPRYPEAHYNLGLAAGRLGLEEEARVHLREAARLGFGGEEPASGSVR